MSDSHTNNHTSPASPAFRPSGFAFSVRSERPGVKRVLLSGELDIATAPQLNDVLAAAARGSAAVILDLTELKFMDSTGLHAILSAHMRLEEANCQLALIPGCHQVQRIFEITGAAEHLEFVDSPDAIEGP